MSAGPASWRHANGCEFYGGNGCGVEDCRVHPPGGRPCTCGLASFLAAVADGGLAVVGAEHVEGVLRSSEVLRRWVIEPLPLGEGTEADEEER